MRFVQMITHKWVLYGAAALALVLMALAGGGYYWVSAHPGTVASSTPAAVFKTAEETNNVYVRFDMEAYDDIMQSYWKSSTETDLAQLFQLSIQKAQSTATTTAPLPALPSPDRAGTAKMLDATLAGLSTDDSRKLAVNIVIVALYNLLPAGRSQLLSQAQETQLRQEVANVNPAKDLYGDLGVAKGADVSAVNAAYTAKAAELAASSSPEAKAELTQVTYAHQVLSDTNDKARYDQGQVEPTVFAHKMGDTLYLYIKQISPTTLQEFAQAVDAASTTPGMDSMILDLRGNVGGALDFATYFLGLFMGPNQYAFDFFHQGNYLPQRTPATVGKFDELARYKDIALLTDNMTQSTAEVTTAMFKRFHLGVVVGGTTRGWGTVENTIPMTTAIDPATSYAILMVQYLTLRDDETPVEGVGIDPNINISDKNWKSELPNYFHSSSIMSALKSEASNPPLQ